MRRTGPAFLLFFLSPLVAEYLLGDLPITLLAALVVLAPLYGGAAVLIREVVRRTGRGWPSILLLSLAYGLIEEGFATQSLFDPNYAHLRLLDYGYVPALGISVPWSIFVLSLHVVWSIGAPIAVVESLTPDRATTPWLRLPGTIVAGVLFGFGAAVTYLLSVNEYHYVASWPHLAVVGVLVVALVVAAMRMPRRRSEPLGSRPAPPAWVVAIVATVAGTAYMSLRLVQHQLAWPVVATLAVVILVAMIWLVTVWSQRAGWARAHLLALATGALLTYAAWSFSMSPVQAAPHNVVLASHIIFAIGAVVLLFVAASRGRHAIPVAA